MFLLQVLFMGSESGTTRPPSPAPSLRLVFQPPSNYMEEWVLGAPFICTGMTKRHESNLSGSAAGTQGGQVRS